jgi:hypothetical protein
MHNALQFRDSFKNIKEDAYIEKLENENNKIEIQGTVEQTKRT